MLPRRQDIVGGLVIGGGAVWGAVFGLLHSSWAWLGGLIAVVGAVIWYASRCPDCGHPTYSRLIPGTWTVAKPNDCAQCGRDLGLKR